MKTITEHIRDHLLASLGYTEPRARNRKPDLDSLLVSEWCPEFETARRYRMVMGALRYGLLADPGKWAGYDLLGGMRRKLEVYHRTGNTEALVDAANYLMLEFMRPSHPHAHFRAEDDRDHCPVATRAAAG